MPYAVLDFIPQFINEHDQNTELTIDDFNYDINKEFSFIGIHDGYWPDNIIDEKTQFVIPVANIEDFTHERLIEIYNYMKEHNVIAADLETAKLAKHAMIASDRYKEETSGIEVNNLSISTDRQSQSLITGAAVNALNNENYVCNWKTNNGFITLDANTIKNVALKVTEHVENCFNKELEITNQINNATTIEEVSSIKW